jgi:hypothetical protein
VKLLKVIAVVAVFSLTVSVNCQAAIVVDPINSVFVSAQTNNSTAAGVPTAGTYSSQVVANDLINVGQPTFTSSTRDKTPSFENNTLNNGTGHPATGSSGNGTFMPDAFAASGDLPILFTFNLNTSVNTFGYDITEIRSFAGWSQNGGALANQRYELLVSLVGSASYISLGTFTYAPFANGNVTTDPTYDTEAGATKMVLIENTTGVIASGVDSIQFRFLGHGASSADSGASTVDGSVYHEVDVIGVATVPEPTNVALMVLGIGFLVCCGKRKA